ncbi:sensor histidine kinase [Humibacter sp. RRB41]|uniref:sensor histidine kinase n=1 Tax=Humibacter sp. RRB41 TaxID=2919946 RepID=UPI001FAA3F61|nr:ATP-binding protein [Humibacter sp. RRB41]
MNGSTLTDVRAGIMRSVRDALHEHGSRLSEGGTLDPAFERQAIAILAEATASIADGSGEHLPPTTADLLEPRHLEALGRLRAGQDSHPAESLLAAEVLFDQAIEPLASWAELLQPPVRAVRVARILHHAVFRRFPPGAVAYTQAMRERLSTAHQESRFRLSRDLHDRVAHGIAAGIQRIELSSLNDGEDASDLSAAAHTLRQTLMDVQNMALDLRQLVGSRTLEKAISDYAAETSTMPPRVVVSSAGPSRPLTASTAEEVFMIVLEAIRNARTHAVGATMVSVGIDWRRRTLAVTIADNGPGFSHDDVTTGSIGLLDMRERADSIGGRLSIATSAGPGTVVRLTIPLTDADT